MTDQERDATIAICLMAAYCDGAKDEKERAEIERITRTLPGGAEASMASLHQDVLLGRRTLASAAGDIGTREGRQLAYEMAVCVCNADGAQSAAEREFLERLHGALGLEPEARAFSRQADALATLPIAEGPVAQAPSPHPPDPAALERSILNAAILNGALELLPQSLATVAIIPLQMRLVYQVGKAYGYELDQGHVRDLLATVGVGLTTQVLEKVGRQLVGGLFRAVGGSFFGGIGGQATGSAVSFASTYALGQVAKKYYGGGRTIDAEGLKQVFREMLGEAEGLGQRYAGEIRAKAQTIDLARLVEGLGGK